MERMVEQIFDVPLCDVLFPRIMKEVVEIVEVIPEKTVEQLFGVSVSRSLETVEVPRLFFRVRAQRRNVEKMVMPASMLRSKNNC